MVERHAVLILVGHTGCGKTTQVPQYLYEAGWATPRSGYQIACTQPRRLAATSVATRVAQEVGTPLGHEVGYSIRFENCAHPTHTRIKYLTDGALLRECMRDPLLTRYSVIMVDEAHERTASTDMLLGVLKKIQRKRPELRLIISSATIDAHAFLDFFSPDNLLDLNLNVQARGDTQSESESASGSDPAHAAVLSLEGRTYPVEYAYLRAATADYVRAAVDTVWQIHLTERAGDVLVFLTGRDEIDACLQALADRALTLPPGSLTLQLLALHAGLSVDEQTAVLAPPARDTRKVVVATNIAEASVTIDGVRFVVDSGMVKLRFFSPSTGADELATVPASLASLTQRAGRAGRTAPGKCFRLFPESALAALPRSTLPELCRTDVAPHLLQLKAMGIDNLVRFEYLPPAPPASHVASALALLASLGALDEHARLTPLGEKMAEMPVEPKLAKLVLDSPRFGCSAAALSIAAMTSVASPFLIPDEGRGSAGLAGLVERHKFTAAEGDHLTLLNVYNAFIAAGSSARWASSHRLSFRTLSRAVHIRSQLARYLPSAGGEAGESQRDESNIRRCITAALFANAARKKPDGTFVSLRTGETLHPHPDSVLFHRSPDAPFIVYGELVRTTKAFVRDISSVEYDWLVQLAYVSHAQPSPAHMALRSRCWVLTCISILSNRPHYYKAKQHVYSATGTGTGTGVTSIGQSE